MSNHSSSDDEEPTGLIPNDAVHGTAMVTVPDPNGNKMVTVTLATHQIMSSAQLYSFRHTDFNSPASVVAQVKKVKEYLKTQAAIVGPNAIKVVLKPFLKSVLRGTIYSSSFRFLWKEVDKDWQKFLDRMVSEVGQLSSNEYLHLALNLYNYQPPNKANLRMTVLHYAGEIFSLYKKQPGYVPHQAVLSHRLLQFVPINVQHLVESELKDPTGDLDMSDYVEKLRKFALLIHPRIMPSPIGVSPSNTTNQSNKPTGKRSDVGGSSGNLPKPPPKPPGNQRGAPQNGPNVQQNQTNKAANNATVPSYTPLTATNNAYKPYNKPVATYQRPGPINIAPPSKQPSFPQPTSGDISMSGSAKVNASGGVSPSTKQLGRLSEVEDVRSDYRVWARVDSGADAHIAGKDVLGHGVPDGRHESLFSVPLQRKALAADCVKVTATTELGDLFTFRGVVSPSTSTCLRPSCLVFDPNRSDPDENYAIIDRLRMPVHVRNNAPYVLLSLSPSMSKSRRD